MKKNEDNEVKNLSNRMKVVGFSEYANHDFVDYVASCFESDKREITRLVRKQKGIFQRESGGFCDLDELQGIIKDAPLIIIARNASPINTTNLESHFFQKCNDLIQLKVVLYFDISELAEASLTADLNINNTVLRSEKKGIPPFFIPNYKETFSKTEGIIDTRLYLKFIRIVNAIKSNELAAYFPKDDFTCGIDPTRKFFGEEDGY